MVRDLSNLHIDELDDFYNNLSEVQKMIFNVGSGSASITDLEKGIVGGDEYNSTTTYAFDDTTKPNSCIKNNKIYTVKSNVTAFSNIEPTVTSGWDNYWEETSISTLSKNLIGFRFITKKTTK